MQNKIFYFFFQYIFKFFGLSKAKFEAFVQQLGGRCGLRRGVLSAEGASGSPSSSEEEEARSLLGCSLPAAAAVALSSSSSASSPPVLLLEAPPPPPSVAAAESGRIISAEMRPDRGRCLLGVVSGCCFRGVFCSFAFPPPLLDDEALPALHAAHRLFPLLAGEDCTLPNSEFETTTATCAAAPPGLSTRKAGLGVRGGVARACSTSSPPTPPFLCSLRSSARRCCAAWLRRARTANTAEVKSMMRPRVTEKPTTI